MFFRWEEPADDARSSDFSDSSAVVSNSEQKRISSEIKPRARVCFFPANPLHGLPPKKAAVALYVLVKGKAITTQNAFRE